MKKYVVPILLIVILTNFIFINSCYAAPSESSAAKGGSYTAKDYKSGSEDGKVTIETANGEQEASTEGSSESILGGVIGLLARLIAVGPMLIHYFISLTVNYAGIVGDASDVDLFTIENVVTGKYFLLDCNVFRTIDDVESTQTKNGNKTLAESLVDIRDQVATWFVILRDFAMALNLAVLLYIAIKLAIATVSTEKAKYKELLYNWLVSMIILFMLHYIFLVINTFSDTLCDVAQKFMENLKSAGNESFENTILTQIFDNFTTAEGLTYGMMVISYIALAWTAMKFFMMYGKRVLTVFFLIIISPLITVTYSIDKIGDGKAQAFSKWMSEYLNNVLIQPLHCFTYLVFMFTANNIAKAAPIVGILFLLSLTKAEKIVKRLLSMSASTVENVGDKFSLKGMKGKMQGMIPKGGG